MEAPKQHFGEERAEKRTTRETGEVNETGGTDGIDLSEIDAVIERLDQIIDWAIEEPSRIGYFAAMYRRVTVAVRDGIVAGRFANDARMAHFDHVFATRFIDAFDTWQTGGQPGESWGLAFDAAGKRRLLIVQQLLLGMNAHINLDLGIAAATIAPGTEIDDLQADFDKISEVLGGLIQGFVADVGALSPWIGWLDRIGGRTEEHIIRFSIDEARKEAWRFATMLAPRSEANQLAPVAQKDAASAVLGKIIRRPGIFLPLGLLVIRARESNDIAKVINQLRT